MHPMHNRHLLGMVWDGDLYIDTTLPFSLRSAPKIFNALADAIEWIAKYRGVSFLAHFLDDFITLSPPGSPTCQRNLTVLFCTCRILNIPLATEKQEGTSTCLPFLGIELDTVKLELRLPAEKLARLQATIGRWACKKSRQKKELESLVGLLHDASIVVRPGRTFLRRLLDLLKSLRHKHNAVYARLNLDTRSDILWWDSFIASWNGLSMMQDARKSNPDVVLTSDDSGSWGCGAYWHTTRPGSSLCGPQPQSTGTSRRRNCSQCLLHRNMGPLWANQSVLCRCDSEAVVYIINSGTSKDPTAMGLMRCLYFFAAKHNLLLSAAHLPGISNHLADALSRNILPAFILNYPQASRHPSPVPAALVDLVVLSKPDWTSPNWNRMFSYIFKQPCQRAQSPPTPQGTAATLTFASAQDPRHTPPPRKFRASSSVVRFIRCYGSKVCDV